MQGAGLSAEVSGGASELLPVTLRRWLFSEQTCVLTACDCFSGCGKVFRGVN